MLIRMKIQEIQLFSVSCKSRMIFFMLMNVKMPIIVGILRFMSISYSAELSMKRVLQPRRQVSGLKRVSIN